MTSFVLIKNLRHNVILGTPFIQLIQHFIVTDEGIEIIPSSQNVIFKFITKPQTKNLNVLQENIINCLISDKTAHLNFLKEDLSFQRMEQSLQQPTNKQKVIKIQNLIEQELCSHLPNAFWNRKQHIITLPYEPDFDKKTIPTKARPSQMNQEVLKYCKQEIQDLFTKNLIRKSKSP